MNYSKIYFFATLCFLVVLPISVSAGVFSLKYSIRGDKNIVTVYFDQEELSVNAIEGTIQIPKGIQVEDVQLGNSRISLWIDPPVVNKKTNTIYFSGVIPNGFIPGEQEIFTLVTKGVGVSAMAIFGSAYLNDGNGTKISISKSGGTEGLTTYINISLDQESPESFTPSVTRDPNLNDGKWSLLFLTNDKASGIDHYEIAEAGTRWWGLFSSEPKYEINASPYTLKDQERRSFLYVKAVDKNGNERIAKISPELSVRAYKILFISLILVVLLVIVFLRRRR